MPLREGAGYRALGGVLMGVGAAITLIGVWMFWRATHPAPYRGAD